MTSFVINHKRYNESDTFTITTPELGTIDARGSYREMTSAGAFGLNFGQVTTPLRCRSTADTRYNATLLFYCSGDYQTLQLVYTCPCDYATHNHSLHWQVRVEGNTIVADTVGRFFNQPHNHPMADGFEDLAPTPYVVSEPPPLLTRQPAKEMQRHCKEPDLPVSVAPSPAEPVAAAPHEPATILPDPRVSRNGQFSLF